MNEDRDRELAEMTSCRILNVVLRRMLGAANGIVSLTKQKRIYIRKNKMLLLMAQNGFCLKDINLMTKFTNVAL